MSMPRFPVTLTALAMLAGQACAQEQPADVRHEELNGDSICIVHDQEGAREAKFTVWALYPSLRGDFQDHVQYLLDLQARLRQQGIGVAVVLPPEHAATFAADKPRMVVATPDAPNLLNHLDGMLCHVTAGSSDSMLVTSQSLDLTYDLIQQCLAGTFDMRAHDQSVQDLQSLWATVGDGGQFDSVVAQCLKQWPHSGRAHACALLNQWWCKGDPAGARQAIDTGLKALSKEAVPMTIFADLVLRGDHNDPQLGSTMAMAMAPVAAGASDGPFTQLVYLRALLRAGQDRLAGRVAAKLPKHIESHSDLQLVFAETLMEGTTPIAYRDIAERAIQRAEANGAPGKWVYAARHKVLKRCGEDQAADQLMDEYRAKNLSSGLNNDAWYLMVQPQSMGRYDTMALAQCREMLRVDKNIDFGSMDTVALAHFCNGKIDTAIEMQTKASEQGGNQPNYVARLRRFEATKAELQQRAKADKK
jgi:hypothetical protein